MFNLRLMMVLMILMWVLIRLSLFLMLMLVLMSCIDFDCFHVELNEQVSFVVLVGAACKGAAIRGLLSTCQAQRKAAGNRAPLRGQNPTQRFQEARALPRKPQDARTQPQSFHEARTSPWKGSTRKPESSLGSPGGQNPAPNRPKRPDGNRSRDVVGRVRS